MFILLSDASLVWPCLPNIYEYIEWAVEMISLFKISPRSGVGSGPHGTGCGTTNDSNNARSSVFTILLFYHACIMIKLTNIIILIWNL
jgi:hypothetical protein